MSATTQPPKPKLKGILKKPSTTTATAPPSSSSPPPLPESADATPPPPLTRAQQLAQQEHRARVLLLQKLRDTELKPPVPLETFELLSQFPRPSSPPPTASSPSPADASLFLSLLSTFQPSEYLDLIEERNCLNKCGYTLCPRVRRNLQGEFKLHTSRAIGGRGKGGGGVARTEDLNKWCSDECALRALYLKVQLDNPSYERRDGKMVVKLELWEEKGTGRGAEEGTGKGKAVLQDTTTTGSSKTTAASNPGSEQDRADLAQAMAQLELDKTKRLAKRDASAAALAAERGDAATGLFTGQSRVEVTIREKSTSDTAVQPPNPEDGGHLKVEGYETTFGTDKKPGKGGESDEDDDDDDPFPTIRYEEVKFE